LAFFSLGYDLSITGNPTGAIEAYYKVIELLTQSHPDIILLHQKGHSSNGREQGDDIDCLNAHANIAQLFIEQGDFSRAEDICRKAIELEMLMPKIDYKYIFHVEHQDVACVYCSLGDCLLAKSDFNGACEAYEKALKRKSINADSLMQFANCLLKMKSSKIEVSRVQLLKKAAKLLKKSIAREAVGLESTEAAAAEEPNYLAGNERFINHRLALYLQLSDCLSDLNDNSGAKAAFAEANAYECDDADDCDCDDEDDDDDDDSDSKDCKGRQ
jgi:Tetratricopeptide repeat